jgi:hypothetical protein
MKRLNFLYRNWIRQIIEAKWFRQKALKTYELSRMLMLIMIMWWLTDELKDFILFRKSSSILWRLIEGNDIWWAVSDKITNNMLKIIWIGKYNIYQAKEQWVDNVIQNFFFSLPILQVAGNMIMDIWDVVDHGFDIQDMRTLTNIPTFWKHLYRWIGRGARSQEKALEEEYKVWDRSWGF